MAELKLDRNGKPLLSCEVQGVFQVVSDPRAGARMTTVRLMGPTAKPESDDLRGAFWVEAKGTGGNAGVLAGLAKGDRIWLAGDLSGAPKWRSKEGDLRDGGLQVWVTEVTRWTGEDPPSAPQDPHGVEEIPF